LEGELIFGYEIFGGSLVNVGKFVKIKFVSGNRRKKT
jgi:hypothetical protein